MPVFPRFGAFDNDIAPLLRLIDNAANYRGEQQPQAHGPDESRNFRRAFSPNFDVHETDKEFVLEGELPGLSDKSNVSIEFADHNTLLVRGKIERSYSAGTPPTEPEQKKIDEHKPPKPTVEDEPETSTEVAKKQEKQEVTKPVQPTTKYWVSERSIGSFQRTFSFPGLIDEEAVSAKLKDGILTIVVPKRQHKAARKIAIE